MTSDWTIEMEGPDGLVLQRICYREAETGKHLFFLTNASPDVPAITVAQLYRERWKIELLFNWIEQNLKIQSVLAISPYAVLSQIWVAKMVYLLLAYLKYSTGLTWTMNQILRLLQLNLFDRRELLELLRTPPTKPPDTCNQLCLEIG